MATNELITITEIREATQSAARRRRIFLRNTMPPAGGLYMLKSDLVDIERDFWNTIPIQNRVALLERYPNLGRYFERADILKIPYLPPTPAQINRIPDAVRARVRNKAAIQI